MGGQIVPLSQTRDFSLVKFKLTREKKQETCSKAITKAHCESLKKKSYNFHRIDNKIYYKEYRINISFPVLILSIHKGCIIRLDHILKNLRRLFDKYPVVRTEHDALVKNSTKTFSNFVAFSGNPNFNSHRGSSQCESFIRTLSLP